MTPFPFWSREVPYQVVLAFVLTALLLRFRRGEHGEFLNTLWIFLLGVGGEALASVVTGMELTTAGELVHSVSRILAAIALIRLSGFALFRLFLPFLGKRPTRIIEDLAIIVAYVIYGFVQLRAAGVDLSSLITTSAILTAVLAFAMQDTLGNVLGGLAIQIDSSVQVGDWVRIDDVVGRVRDVRWRSTIIETRNWETLVIPNSALMKSRVAILGRREGAPIQWRRILNFMVDAGVPPARVIAIVDDEMQEIAIPNVARMPAASCVLYGFEQGNLRYQLRYFLTDLLEDDSTDSMVRVHLFASLQRAGIRISEPQYTVHSITRDEKHDEKVRKRELGRRLEMLRGIDLFGPLSDSEREEIAERLQYAPFARGDVMTKQGNAAHWLYIVTFGEAEVLYEPPNGGPPQVLGTLKQGQFFGEMALLTGKARAATVVAKTDVECYRLDRASFQSLLNSRPEIADQVSKIVGDRKPDLERMREDLASQPPPAPPQIGLMTRIRRFLGFTTTAS